jgi:hypothetical protein
MAPFSLEETVKIASVYAHLIEFERITHRSYNTHESMNAWESHIKQYLDLPDEIRQALPLPTDAWIAEIADWRKSVPKENEY